MLDQAQECVAPLRGLQIHDDGTLATLGSAYGPLQPAASARSTAMVDALQLALDLVKAGMASTVLARAAYKPALDAGLVSEIQIDEPTLETRLILAEASNRPITQAMRYVRQEIKLILDNLTATAGAEYGLVPLS